MIKPVNGHLLIEPLKHETFMASERGTYEEIGTVVDIAPNTFDEFGDEKVPVQIQAGSRVYFDSWLAAKYPTGTGNDFFWLVPWKDVRAIEKKDGDKVPE